jgi:hypothetical protein
VGAQAGGARLTAGTIVYSGLRLWQILAAAAPRWSGIVQNLIERRSTVAMSAPRWSFWAAHDSTRGMKMKLISKAFMAAGLVALGACGGGDEENTAANTTASDEIYNVAPDDLGAENLLDNGAVGNDAGLDDGTTDTGDTGSSADNASGNSTGNTQ